ncbi:hypothetical protein PoB_006604000 [Plakobranchus ocellatus]|uniref:Uncharacterized protein n=1 Tax=Plakobranchus ocellatus TaxID=259542 RepID=A0AAV4D5V9_9GAST|nr:hypothetical protein PoB_006604000 [Plakobranchus ocellatus]
MTPDLRGRGENRSCWARTKCKANVEIVLQKLQSRLAQKSIEQRADVAKIGYARVGENRPAPSIIRPGIAVLSLSRHRQFSSVDQNDILASKAGAKTKTQPARVLCPLRWDRNVGSVRMSINQCSSFSNKRNDGDIDDSKSGLGSAGILSVAGSSPSTAPWPDGGPESLRSPFRGLAIITKPTSDSALVTNHFVLKISNHVTFLA